MTHIPVCPLLLPIGQHVYCGFVTILGHSYQVSLKLPVSGDLQKATLDCEWKLQHKIKHKTDIIAQRLRNATGLAPFLKEFIIICESCLKTSSSDQLEWIDPMLILQQVQDLGWERVHDMAADFSTVGLTVTDSGGRLHKVKVMLDKQDFSVTPVCSVDLPAKFNFHWSGKSGLRHIYQQFEAAVASYQQFWNMLAEIDANCWVLEPEKPTYAANHRRIAIGPNISLHVVVNCRQPSTLPECRLMGADSAVAELREKLNTNLHRWDVDRSLLKNLEEVLDIDFPAPSDTSKENLMVECGICYCHNLDAEIPDIVCEDKRCGQPFHRTCLSEWLRSLSARQSFNTVFGDCPLCSHPIRVKLMSS